MLITGETGTGKELIARALHRLSGRPGELVAVNVAGLDDTMFSDTLFGHARGSFTGADRPREGLIASAGDGTIFLDEIGDLSVASQVKLLRLLQDGSFYPARRRSAAAEPGAGRGGDQLRRGARRSRRGASARTSTTACAPITSTCRPLRAPAGRHSAPGGSLRREGGRELGKAGPEVPLALYQLLRTYSFPGQRARAGGAGLRRGGPPSGRDPVTRRASRRRSAGEGTPAAIEEEPDRPITPLADLFPDRLPTLREAQDALIAEALRRTDGNQGVAAVTLAISRQALNKRLSRRRRHQPSPDAGD